ncbi:unnamed protein product [Rangifer tarandus platyrhynchus]|uniref:Uncharacterized protein n=1 Tax=Rangifer tarandus platyrhynchus TaxID=3082113 RepID=A0AC59YAR7_RANTA
MQEKGSSRLGFSLTSRVKPPPHLPTTVQRCWAEWARERARDAHSHTKHLQLSGNDECTVHAGAELRCGECRAGSEAHRRGRGPLSAEEQKATPEAGLVSGYSEFAIYPASAPGPGSPELIFRATLYPIEKVRSAQARYGCFSAVRSGVSVCARALRQASAALRLLAPPVS